MQNKQNVDLDSNEDGNEICSDLRGRIVSSSDIVIIDNEKSKIDEDRNMNTNNRSTGTPGKYFSGWCGLVQGFCRFSINRRTDSVNLVEMHFCNSDFFVFLIVFGICIFLGFVCILYGFGQVTQLVLSNYWCQNKTVDEIHAHSIEYGLNEGTDEGCWKSKQLTVNIYRIECFKNTTGRELSCSCVLLFFCVQLVFVLLFLFRWTWLLCLTVHLFMPQQLIFRL